MSSIETITSVTDMSSRSASWSFSPKVALVPTMGYLHEGHLALVREASRLAENVIVSIYVNPLQFGPSEDFERYPRNMDRDLSLLSQLGVKTVFAPEAFDVTPKSMIYQVDPGNMANVLCGRYRPGHFIGVATIVAKLFNIVKPGLAVFGWKDAQQFLLLDKMTHDLNIPVQLRAVETEREADGLALSSRNVYLNASQRAAAPSIYKGLQSVRQRFEENPSVLTEDLKKTFRQEIERQPELELQYIEIVSQDSLQPLEKVYPGHTVIATAVYAGKTRLIDNIRI